MKKILFPTDFSAAADHAFIYALKLAKQIGAGITTLHCFELPALKGINLPNTIKEIYESISLEEFENFRDNVPHLREIAEKAGLESVPVKHIMQEGEAIFNIVRLAEKEEADLIVMGTTGASGMKKIFLGSVAAEVMENAPCPVLAIPENAHFDGEIDHIAFTTEYKKDEIKALNWLANWPALKGADIHCVHVDLLHIEGLAHKMDAFRKQFEDLEKLHFEVVDHTSFEKAITGYLKKKNIDLLAMVIHHRNFFKELFSYSFTKNLAYHLNTPIIAIPEKAIKKLSQIPGERQFGLAGLPTL